MLATWGEGEFRSENQLEAMLLFKWHFRASWEGTRSSRPQDPSLGSLGNVSVLSHSSLGLCWQFPLAGRSRLGILLPHAEWRPWPVNTLPTDTGFRGYLGVFFFLSICGLFLHFWHFRGSDSLFGNLQKQASERPQIGVGTPTSFFLQTQSTSRVPTVQQGTKKRFLPSWTDIPWQE